MCRRCNECGGGIGLLNVTLQQIWKLNQCYTITIGFIN